jgi:alkylation response protein AidB-like acyl-CoA dehydrogenase
VRFTFTAEQRLFQAAVRDLLAKECPPAAVRAAWEVGKAGQASDQLETAAAERWRHLADMGVVGVLAPPDRGGLGLTEVDLVLLIEECGRAAVPEPVVESVAVAVPLLAAAGDDRVADVASGAMLATVGLAEAGPYVASATNAGLLLLQHGDDVHALEPGDVVLSEQRSMDGGRHLSLVSWSPREATRLNLPPGEVAIAFDRGVLAVSAQLVGLASHMVELAADYAREREQFGHPIGSFQAVKHLLADALLCVEFARPVVYRAAWTVASGGADRAAPASPDPRVRARDVSMAKAYASDAARRAARVALQVHGAIGYTWEHDLHLWMKKAWALAAAWGDAGWHRRRVGTWLLGSPAVPSPGGF